MDDAILCEGLTKRYGGPPPRQGPPGEHAAQGRAFAVDHLDLKVEKGEFFGLLGPNGAGKTTTIGMLTTRVVPSDGRAVVAGVDVVAEPARARALLACVTQTNTLDRGLSVEDNLYFHGRYFGLPRKECRRRAQALLERFDLRDKAKARVEHLSGGLAQRVLIARALLHEPQVLFLDEPTSGLDPQSRHRLWQELEEINRKGQSIVLTTHDMEEADRLCGRVAIVDQGKLLALDTPEALKATVQSDRVVWISLTDAAAPQVAQALEALPGVTKVAAEGARLCIHTQNHERSVGDLVRTLTEAGGHLKDLTVSEPSLETVFLALTGKEYHA